ncbi:MAG: single-stranded-DNA-specific exonuclease RecJ [Candidatus Omnitrophica bacterium]|nr:single-stranded-DNA-specific exonuclease RecJ [Candidatus Omnitrophota bacterium]
MRKRWVTKNQTPFPASQISKSTDISHITAQLLINRGINTPEEADAFLKPSFSHMHEPRLLKGMDKSVARIRQAISKKERILICGDYDVDGLSAVAILKPAIESLGGNVFHYIPNRLEDGYGLGEKAVQFAIKKKAQVVLTVDSGISAIKEVDDLNREGIDSIVTDHHHPQDTLPKAFAVIDPLQDGCSYPFKGLSGSGIAYKFASALLNDKAKTNEYLDLAALGTIADIVPLIGENRVIVHFGLEKINKTKRAGLRALIEVSRLGGKRISAKYVGYILGPRINAQGRLGSSEEALRLLVTDKDDEAKELASTLDKSNRDRQGIERGVYEEAVSKLEREINFKHHRVIVLHGDNWHAGVIGIVASKLVDKYFRPVALVSFNGDAGKGSARSLGNFHITDALKKCGRLLERYGGHKHAAGFSLTKDNLAGFKELLNEIAHADLAIDDLTPVLEADMELALSDINLKLLEEIEAFAPFGMGNPVPIFISKGMRMKGQPRFLKRDCMRFDVTDGNKVFQAVSFGSQKVLEDEFDCAYALSFDEWDGRRGIQLEVKDLKGLVKEDLFA